MASGRLKKWVACGTLNSLCVLTNWPWLGQRFCREVVTWKTLRHPNVLPLLGVTMTETRFVMVSEWMEKGNINEFVKRNAETNRLMLVRLCSRSSFSLVADNYMVTVARRRY